MTEEKKEKPAAAEKKEEKKEKEEKIPKKFEDIVKKVEEMSVMDLAELVQILEKRFNVSAAAPMAVAAQAPAGASPEAGAAEEKSEFNVVLTSVGEKKIEVIKVVRDITQKGLKEAKDMVDAAANEAQTIKESVKKEEAEEMKKKFEAAGAKVELK